MDEGSDKAPRRKRVSRACDRCRSKKDKCDGIRPTCSACQASGQTCSYDPHAKKRGLPEGYVRGLEKLWALSICNIDGFEETMLSMLGTTLESAGRRGKVMSVWTDDNNSESLHETWKTSRLFSALEKMLSNSEPVPTTTGKRSRNPNEDYGDGPDNQWGFRVGREMTPLGAEAPRVVGPSGLSPTAKRARLAQAPDNRGSQLSSSPHTLQLPPQTSQLLDIYFATTHSWFPIVAKHNILRASYLYANAPFSVATTSPGSGDHATLWAILSYTITQSRTDPRARPVGALSLAREYYAVARNLIPLEKERYELGHIQALLLLTLVNMGLEDWTASWLLSGQAVRMAIAMGLGSMTDTRRSDELRQGKAVFLGCFVIDSLLSFRLSRSPAMSSNDLATVGLLEEDGLEEWNSWVDVLPPTGVAHGKNPPRRGPLLALSCFNRLVELASVLNKTSRNLAMGYKPASFAQQLVADLKQWEDGLPLGCRLIGPESIYPDRHSALLPHQTYLGLTYVATLLWLYLRLIPGEQGLHRTQRAATEGAKKLLYRGLSMISQHLENFPMCGLPPIFEFAMRTISEQAFSLRQTVDSSDSFPFAQWAEEFQQKTTALIPTWPVYGSLVSSMDRWQQPHEYTGPQPGFPAVVPPAMPGTAPLAPMQPAGAQGMLPHDQGSYASSILGISIPVDGQSLTPKDTVMENTEMSMMDVPLQQAPPPPPMDARSILSDKVTPRSGPDVMYPPGSAPPQPHTPDSATSNPMMGKPPTSDRPGPTSDMGFNPAGNGDLDAIFKDLAYLDTTEWSNNREAGLKDFGFLDDSTFQAFCHDPDRLVGSQPLVHPPSIADIWPPPGFFPEMFQEVPEKTMNG
ncbi:transcriptional regulator family: Fungal Specific TF [Penicillium longicatenatum]|uniref:transcriptional regulator family: Fungal Specific TF n=1 Tax=Penicillium longicatenatum TaxID=1561947 RepID=UPI00254845B9|nr:transcriptional regulator family: Fungal Specific TF [Penicillium longicatenatum]KAJ5660739.1 transcriptional regulator family: Fungal Specific TF [Penicillium longicatenatum]